MKSFQPVNVSKLTSTPPSPPPLAPLTPQHHVIQPQPAPPPASAPPSMTPPTSNSFSSRVPNLGQHPLLRQPFTLPTSQDSFMPPTFPPANVPRLDLPADENVDLEELEQFAKEFKQRRIKLGKHIFF